MTSLHFLYWVDVNGDVDCFEIVVSFERFDFSFYQILDFHRVVVAVELDEDLFDVLIFDPRHHGVFGV